jgi:hypothetical protein
MKHRIAESYQIVPTTRFAAVCFACFATAKGQASTPRYDTYCKIWVKNTLLFCKSKHLDYQNDQISRDTSIMG